MSRIWNTTVSPPPVFNLPVPLKSIERIHSKYTTPYTITAPDTGKDIWVFPSLLSDKNVEKLIEISKQEITKRKNSNLLIENREISSILREILKDDVMDKIGLEFTDFVTILYGSTPISIHIDKQDICLFTHKVLVYLNQLPENTGGTIFYTEDEREFAVTPNNTGTVVVFNSGLKHASQEFPKEFVKISIGIRARLINQ